LNNNVFRRHCFWNIFPTAESVTFFLWNRGEFYFCAVLNINCLINIAINYISYCITVYTKCTFYSDVVCRYFFRCFAPTAKRMSLFYWYLFQYYCIANKTTDTLIL
jgi:hypothetical protein